MHSNDMQISIKIRGVLVRHGIDTSRLLIETFTGKVFIKGRIQKRAGGMRACFSENRNSPSATAKSDLALIMQIEDDIKRIHEVTDIRFKLDNFIKDKGKWRIRA
jgi:hypothetical protein